MRSIGPRGLSAVPATSSAPYAPAAAERPTLPTPYPRRRPCRNPPPGTQHSNPTAPSGDVFMLLICAQLRVPYPAHHLAWQPSGREITCHLRTAPGAPHNLDAIASGQASWRVPKGPVRLSSRRDSGCSGQTKGSTAQWAQSEWGDGAGTAGGCRGVGGHPPPSAGAGSS